jgi:hypothetical protein
VTLVDLGMAAFATLLPVSVLTGIAVLLVFRRASDPAAVRRAKNQATAHLLEFRLFMDEPRLILRAQRDLVVANLRFMKLMLRPVLVLLLPMALLLVEMDAFYGHVPLAAGQPAIVTAHLEGDPSAIPLELEAPSGIAVESPGVRIPAAREVSWRIRPWGAASGSLQLHSGDRVLTKTVASGRGVRYLSERRASLAGFIWHPTEPPITGSAIDWIEVRYPPAQIFHLHWLVWFFAVSGITALLLRRKLRAVF